MVKILYNTKISAIIFGASLLLGMIFVPFAYGQASDWAYTPSLDTAGNGVTLRSVTHSGNTIIDRANLPYILVYYVSGTPNPVRDDFPWPPGGWGLTAHGGEKHTFAGGEWYHAIFYVGCQDWGTGNVDGCYKYEQMYYVYNNGPNGKPEIEFWLKAWGRGYYLTRGDPTSYEVYWRVDTDVKGSTNDKYEQYSGSWSEVTNETPYTTIGSTDGGIEWRTYDTGVGNGVGKRIEIWPVLQDFDKIWLLLFKGTKTTPNEFDTNPDSFDDPPPGENIVSKDDLYWYRTQRLGSECQPASPCSQVHVITLSGL